MYVFFKCTCSVMNSNEFTMDLGILTSEIMKKIGDFNISNTDDIWVVAESISSQSILLYLRYQNDLNETVESICFKLEKEIELMLDYQVLVANFESNRKSSITIDLIEKTAIECHTELNNAVETKNVLFSPRLIYKFVGYVFEE